MAIELNNRNKAIAGIYLIERTPRKIMHKHSIPLKKFLIPNMRDTLNSLTISQLNLDNKGNIKSVVSTKVTNIGNWV